MIERNMITSTTSRSSCRPGEGELSPHFDYRLPAEVGTRVHRVERAGSASELSARYRHL